MRVVNLQQRTPQWLAWRRSGIGGSDAYIIDGTSPYGKSLRELYWEKKGIDLVEKSSNDFIFEMGHKLEKIARADFLEIYGVEISPICIEHKEDSRFIASLDGFHADIGPVEVKFCGKAIVEEAISHSRIPPHHYTQIQHQLFVSGCESGYWFGGAPDGSCHTLKIEYNHAFYVELREKCLRFLHDLDNDIEPLLGAKEFFVPQDLSLLERLADAKFLLETSLKDFELAKINVLSAYNHPKIAGAGIRVITNKNGETSVRLLKEINAKEETQIHEEKHLLE